MKWIIRLLIIIYTSASLFAAEEPRIWPSLLNGDHEQLEKYINEGSFQKNTKGYSLLMAYSAIGDNEKVNENLFYVKLFEPQDVNTPVGKLNIMGMCKFSYNTDTIDACFLSRPQKVQTSEGIKGSPFHRRNYL